MSSHLITFEILLAFIKAEHFQIYTFYKFIFILSSYHILNLPALTPILCHTSKTTNTSLQLYLMNFLLCDDLVTKRPTFSIFAAKRDTQELGFL